MRSKAMSASNQLFAQFVEVVDFSIVRNLDRSIFVGNRLMSGGNVDNCKPARRQRCLRPPRLRRGTVLGTISRIEEKPFAVRATMLDHIGHALDQASIDWPTVKVNYAANSTHRLGTLVLRR